MQKRKTAEKRKKGKGGPSTKGWGWDTSDDEEVLRRQERAAAEPMKVILHSGGDHRFYGNYRVESEETGRAYRVEIRSLLQRENTCECQDFRVNQLGTCKHIERTLLFLRRSKHKAFLEASRAGSPRVEVFLNRSMKQPQVCVRWPKKISPALKRRINALFSADGTLLASPDESIPSLKRIFEYAPTWRDNVRISYEIDPLVAGLERRKAREDARKKFLIDVKDGKRSVQVVKHRLYGYQQEGMLHLAFSERALLADDMGLGKTVQAIAACEVLRHVRGIRKVLIVCPASLKGEWEDQIGKFTDLPALPVYGSRDVRLKQYQEKQFFHIVNYEQVRNDFEVINDAVSPDVVILDEAQRIKNWQTKTARAVKRLDSAYAFVLTGTPLENRIDELYSIVDFLDPEIFGPLFRFNREFYEFNERGRPVGYKNLKELNRRVSTIMLRRKKSDVEDQLPGRTTNNYFVHMEPEQQLRYDEFDEKVARIAHILKKRPLTRDEREAMQRMLACMRMLCDTTYILDQDLKISPKIEELRRVIEEIQSAQPEAKIVIFSEWVKMLELVADLMDELGVGVAHHTGEVPQKKRRAELKRFRESPDCRALLSTDSGGLGLNLQAASIVINMDLPWNPAKLEQRIARAWRKGQTRTVNVINLICADSIESRMLDVMEVKQELADGVLEGKGELDSLKMASGPQAQLERIQKVLGVSVPPPQTQEKVPAETRLPAEILRQDLVARYSNRLLHMLSQKNDQGETILIVLDEVTPDIRRESEALLKQSQGRAGRVTLEFIDQKTFESIQHLKEAGLITTTGEERILHSTGAEKSRDTDRLEKQRQLEEARTIFAGAERSRKMANVLKDGGFPQEALSAFLEAMEIGLQAAACLSGIHEGGAVPMEILRTRLSELGILGREDIDLVGRLRSTSENRRTEEEATETLESAQQIVHAIEQRLQEDAITSFV